MGLFSKFDQIRTFFHTRDVILSFLSLWVLSIRGGGTPPVPHYRSRHQIAICGGGDVYVGFKPR